MFEDRGFGRLAKPDVRDYAYPMRAVLRPAPLPTNRYYQTGPLLPMDQGGTGTCVAHAWVAFLCAALMMSKTPPNVYDTYRKIVAIDEWTENDHEATATDISVLQSGTSIRAGAKHFQDAGHLKSYLWTRSADEAATWLLTGRGTLVMGTNWYWDMSNPTVAGLVNIGGGLAGGHAYLCIGYNRTTKMFRFLNSWGRAFGQQGRFWMRHVDMQRLIEEDGECCAAVEQLIPPVR